MVIGIHGCLPSEEPTHHIMPYSGLLDGEQVIPPLVDDDATVICPRCNGEMSVV
jgi:hypothetical protein